MSNPQAYIKVRGSRLNVEQGNAVYLEKDTEFAIELYNPTQGRIGALISINGKSFSDKFIIRPGETVTIERYIEEARKFKFDTYMVDGSAETKKAIKDNGGITVSFYREKEQNYTNISRGISKGFPSNPNVWYSQDMSDYNISNTIGGQSEMNFNLTSSNFNVNDQGEINLDWMEQEHSRGFNDEGKTRGATNKGMNFSNQQPVSAKIETGRVEKGSHSNQSFHTVDVKLEYSAFHSINIKLLPLSQRPEEETLYCSGCGRRFRTKEKFCPKCGTAKVSQ